MRWSSLGTFVLGSACAFGLGWGVAHYGWFDGAAKRPPTVPPVRPRWSQTELTQRPSVADMIAEMQAAAKSGSFVTQRWDTMIRALEKADMSALIDAVEALREGNVKSGLRQMLFRRWGELEPEVAMARALLIERVSQRESTIGAVATGWATANPDGLWAWARVQPEGIQRDLAISAYLNQVTQSDPVAAWTIAKWWGPPERWSYSVNQIFNGLAARDREFALKEANGLTGTARTNALQGIATAWATQDPRAALDWVNGLPSSVGNKQQLIQQVLNSWAQLDPVAAAGMFAANTAPNAVGSASTIASRWAETDFPAALAWAKSLENLNAQRQALQGLMGRWNEDPKAGLAEIADLNPTLRRDFTNQLIGNWSRREPDAALGFVRGLTDPEQHDNGISAVANSMPDPKAALALLAEVNSPTVRDSLSQNLVGRLARADPEAALEYARSIPGEFEQMRVIQQVANNLSYDNPDKAAELAALLPAGQQRNNVLMGIINGLANRDVNAALRFAEEMPEGSVRSQALQNVAMRMIEMNPDGALAVIEKMPLSSQRDNAMSDYVGRLSARSMADAINFVSQMPLGRARDQAQGRIVSQMSQTDPKQAAAYIETMPPGQGQTNAINQVASNWAGKNPETALAWATGLPDANLRDSSMRTILSTVANWSPAKAIAMLDSMPFSPGQVDSAYSSIAGPWAQSDPQSAVAWAASLPQAQQDRTLPQVLNSWTNSQPQAAATWVQQMPDPVARDKAITSMASSYSFQNPALAATWTEAITDPRLRDQATESVARAWLNQDKATATAWVLNSQLPAQRKQVLLQGPAPRGARGGG